MIMNGEVAPSIDGVESVPISIVVDKFSGLTVIASVLTLYVCDAVASISTLWSWIVGSVCWIKLAVSVNTCSIAVYPSDARE